ncbi:hypothetical protein IW15_22015 [Chryseobacterium soli]|uniref:Uncharacterized protein n=2 Tax=Chryseobacterium soli TaxID=445961 RepID=A0A085ZZR5_9FLAO|nr:hypothetical protein IW15_22015 [Chryseobacterium soli]
MPTNENKILIDKLIKVTDFEDYFNNYCKKKIEQTAKENNWDDKKKQEIVNSVNFERFNATIYNAFARDSKENLEDMIVLFRKLNENHNSSMIKLIPINAMIQYSLEGFVERLVEEK